MGLLGAGMMVVVLRHIRIFAWDSDWLNMSFSTSESRTVPEGPAWDLLWACSFARVDFLQRSPQICCCHTEGKLTRWEGELVGGNSVGNLKNKLEELRGV